MNHLKRGKALRERLPLTYLVSKVSQTSLQSYTSEASKDQWKPADGAKGDRGPLRFSTGAMRRRAC